MIRLDHIDSLLPEEFRSIEETVRRADYFGKLGQYEVSERYYRLAYAKTELLKKNLEYIENRNSAMNQPADEPLATAGEIYPENSIPAESPAVNADKEVVSMKDVSDEESPEKSPIPPPGYFNPIEPPAAVPVEKAESSASPISTVQPEAQPVISQQHPPRKQASKEAQEPAPKDPGFSADTLIGRETVYLVRKRETVKMVGAKTGVNWWVIARENRLDPKKPIEPGTILRIDTRRIVPKHVKNGIVINIPDKTLYLFKDGRLKRTYPVGLGMGKLKDLFTWETPTGKFRIVSKIKDPEWYIPYSIQQELKKGGKEFSPIVPPGPKNPLGKYALGTTIDGILIHGTTNPGSVNRFRSHGCIRLLPGHMEEFFKTVRVNTSGEIIYEPVKAAISNNGRVFLEIHADPYKKVRDLEAEAKKVLEGKNAINRVDWQKVKALLKSGSGLVEDVTASM
jgi:L,D-transpeptidase ErfK/SrfK